MESGVKCRLHLRRKPRHYVMNNALPAVLLGIFNLLVFAIPTDAREKNVSCDDRVSVSWCLFVELKYSTSIDFYKTSLLEVYDVFQMTLGLWSSLFRFSNLSFTTGSRSRREGLKVFQRFRPHWEGFTKWSLYRMPCGKSQKIWDQRKERNGNIQGRPWRRGYKWRCWWRDRSELSSAY